MLRRGVPLTLGGQAASLRMTGGGGVARIGTMADAPKVRLTEQVKAAG